MEIWRSQIRFANCGPGSHPGQAELPRSRGHFGGESDVEAEEDDVPFLHQIVLTLQAPLAGFLGSLLAATRDKVLVAHDLGADESGLEVGVNAPGGLRSRRLAARFDREEAVGVEAGQHEAVDTEHHQKSLQPDAFAGLVGSVRLQPGNGSGLCRRSVCPSGHGL